MKNLITLVVVFLSFQSTAQDTIVHKSGKVEAVQILSLNTTSKLMVYLIAYDTIYASTNNFEKYILHSELGNSSVSETPSDQIANSQNRIFTRKKTPSYDYGKFSISTNLLALVPIFPTNGRMTIETEYELNKNFTIKTPITFGVNRRGGYTGNYLGRNTYGPSTYGIVQGAYFHESPGITVINMPKRYNQHDVVFQFGLNPKYYPFGKSVKPISLYLGACFNMGITDRQQWDFYQTLDTISYYQSNDPRWEVTVDKVEISKNEFFFFNYEAQLGIDYNFSKSFNAGFEVLYSSQIIGNAKLNDRVFEKRFDDADYTLALEKEAFLDRTYIPVRFRIFLIYRFGGKLRE